MNGDDVFLIVLAYCLLCYGAAASGVARAVRNNWNERLGAGTWMRIQFHLGTILLFAPLSVPWILYLAVRSKPELPLYAVCAGGPQDAAEFPDDDSGE